jgi:hypothetical protein
MAMRATVSAARATPGHGRAALGDGDVRAPREPARVPRRRPSRLVSAALVLLGCVLLYVSLPNLGPVIRAATADGTPGTFTARKLTCVSHPGHRTCEWSGTFTSHDGLIQRRGVGLYAGGPDTLASGESTPAVDVGNPGRVYRPGGSREWIFTVALLLTGYLCLAWAARRHLAPPPAPHHTTARQPERACAKP